MQKDIIDLKITVNQFNIIKMYAVFTQQQDTNSIQIAIDCKPRDVGLYPGDIKQGTNISWSKGIEIIQNLFSCHCGIMLGINIKRYLKITHIFSNTVWHLLREIFDLAFESLNKVRDWKNTEGDCREEFKWEIHSKHTL